MKQAERIRWVGVASALAIAGAAGTVQADPVQVTAWDYRVITQFANQNTFDTGTGTQLQDGRQVSWGGGTSPTFADVFTPGVRSGITIADGTDGGAGTNDRTVSPQQGSVLTDFDLIITVPEVGAGAWITHHNNPIDSAFSTLLTSVINSELTLWAKTPAPPYTGGFGDPASSGPTTIPFKIFFAETTNDPAGGNCTPGTGNPPCGDIFALNADQVLDNDFSFNGFNYFVQIFTITANGQANLTPLSNEACARAGASAGCFGFVTPESQDTTIQFGFAITSERFQAPEPGILALLGSSLFGLAAFRRRRTS